MQTGLHQLFHETYRDLRPRSDVPELRVEFFSFANINNTIRLREGRLLVRISDLLEGAPEYVLRAIAHILLAKMYRKPVDRQHAVRYRRYVSGRHMSQKAYLVRQIRGRKQLFYPQGHTYERESIFDDLNVRLCYGLLVRPKIRRSSEQGRMRIGHY